VSRLINFRAFLSPLDEGKFDTNGTTVGMMTSEQTPPEDIYPNSEVFADDNNEVAVGAGIVNDQPQPPRIVNDQQQSPDIANDQQQLPLSSELFLSSFDESIMER
jgi:hypothetical protein